MRAVIQRVKDASVTVDETLISQIDHGLLIYLGIHENDDEAMVLKMAYKLLNLRIFEDDQQKMNLSVKDVNGSMLIISQFTLYGDAKKGNRPSFIEAARPLIAETLYQDLIKELEKHIGVVGGQFQAHMKVKSINDGPVTIIYEI